MGRYIITGGPGAGKTSLLRALDQLHYACSEEVSRQLIMEESAKGSGCLPWTDLPCFAKKALDRMITAWHAAAENALTFFDRGMPDIIAYLTVAGLPVAKDYEAAVNRYPYARTVFLLTPWREIYVQDEARWQTFEEAERIGQQIAGVYRSSGYEILELPRCPVEQRVDFILKRLSIL